MVSHNKLKALFGTPNETAVFGRRQCPKHKTCC